MNNQSIMFNGVEFKTGNKVTCAIHGKEIKEAKIYIPAPEDRREKIIYICQNIKSGSDSPDKLGYLKSWGTRIGRAFDGKQITLHDVYNLKLATKRDELVSIVSSVFGVNNE